MRLPPARQRMAQAARGYLLDLVFGELPETFHPLVAFGHAMQWIEGRLYADSRLSGLGYMVLGVGPAAALGHLFSAAPAACYLSCGGRALAAAALDVSAALDGGDLDLARSRLKALVGRDTSALDEGEISRAAVESVAENSVDAVVAPLFFTAALGGAGSLGHRAANTLDAMVGYRNERYCRFGWASARLDDALAYLPARLTAVLIAAVRPGKAGGIWQTVRRDAPSHPSPNAGVAEAAFAAALGVTLGGTNSYGGRLEHRTPLGRGRPVEPGDIAAAVRLLEEVGLLAAVLLAAASLTGGRGEGGRR